MMGYLISRGREGRSSLDHMIREIYANEVAGKIGQGAQYCFHAFSLQDRIAGVAADDDARV